MREEDVGGFTYVVPPLPEEEATFICVVLLIPMGWLNFTLLLCAESDTVEGIEKIYIIDPSSSFTKYVPTSGSYYTPPYRTAYPAHLQGTTLYMDNLMYVSQG